jgi:hypothetical protein
VVDVSGVAVDESGSGATRAADGLAAPAPSRRGRAGALPAGLLVAGEPRSLPHRGARAALTPPRADGRLAPAHIRHVSVTRAYTLAG